MLDAVLGDDKELPVVFRTEEEDIRVTARRHAMDGDSTGYIIEAETFSDLREEWRLIGRMGDFDLHTVIALLTEAARELYRRRAIDASNRQQEDI